MRCVICDVELSEGEITFDRELKSEPCTTCKQIIYETAFSGKFKHSSTEADDPDDLSDDFEPDDEFFAAMIEEEFYAEQE